VLKEIPSNPGRSSTLRSPHHLGAKSVAFENCMEPKRVHTFFEVGQYNNTCNLETSRHPWKHN
jgi:hypothetical protein